MTLVGRRHALVGRGQALVGLGIAALVHPHLAETASGLECL
jgi:hypothetical protein